MKSSRRTSLLGAIGAMFALNYDAPEQRAKSRPSRMFTWLRGRYADPVFRARVSDLRKQRARAREVRKLVRQRIVVIKAANLGKPSHLHQTTKPRRVLRAMLAQV